MIKNVPDDCFPIYTTVFSENTKHRDIEKDSIVRNTLHLFACVAELVCICMVLEDHFGIFLNFINDLILIKELRAELRLPRRFMALCFLILLMMYQNKEQELFLGSAQIFSEHCAYKVCRMNIIFSSNIHLAKN